MLLVSAAARYKLLPSNGERTTMADGEVEEEEPQAGDRKGKGKKEKKNWEDEGMELLIVLYDCLWNVAHEYCMNREKEEVAYCQIDAQTVRKI